MAPHTPLQTCKVTHMESVLPTAHLPSLLLRAERKYGPPSLKPGFSPEGRVEQWEGGQKEASKEHSSMIKGPTMGKENELGTSVEAEQSPSGPTTAKAPEERAVHLLSPTLCQCGQTGGRTSWYKSSEALTISGNKDSCLPVLDSRALWGREGQGNPLIQPTRLGHRPHCGQGRSQRPLWGQVRRKLCDYGLS